MPQNCSNTSKEIVYTQELPPSGWYFHNAQHDYHIAHGVTKAFILTPVTQICTIYPEFPRISMWMKLNIFIYCKWYFCVSYEREICAFMTTCSNCHWNLHLARTCHTIKYMMFCSESVGFFSSFRWINIEIRVN